jgi:hypothetical protein
VVLGVVSDWVGYEAHTQPHKFRITRYEFKGETFAPLPELRTQGRYDNWCPAVTSLRLACSHPYGDITPLRWHKTFDCGDASLGAAADAPADAILEHVIRELGGDAIVCGRFKFDFIRRAKLKPAELKALRRCVTNAHRTRQSFFFSIEGSGVDSYVGRGLLGTGAGEIKRFRYDSASCWRADCHDLFLLSPCPVPPVGQLIDPEMKCDAPNGVGSPATR